VLIVAGASALDPLDPVLRWAHAAGRAHGAPRRSGPPGSLLWYGDLGRATPAGMPTCGMFSQATTFDLALPQILARRARRQPQAGRAGVHGGLPTRAGHGVIASRRTGPTRPGESSRSSSHAVGRCRVSTATSSGIGGGGRAHRGELPGATAVRRDVNPLCGDRVRLMAEGRARGPDRGGALPRRLHARICTASADVLADLSPAGRGARPMALEVADVLAVLQAEIRPTRMRCVTLRSRCWRRLSVSNGARRTCLSHPRSEPDHGPATMTLDEQTRPDFPILQRIGQRPSARVPRLGARRARSRRRRPRGDEPVLRAEPRQRSPLDPHPSAKRPPSSTSWPATPRSGSSAPRAGKRSSSTRAPPTASA